MPLPLRRSRAGASLLLLFGAVVVVSVALLAGSSVFLAGSTLHAMRTTLADAPATDAALRVSSSFDPTTAAAEDAATRAVLDDAFAGVRLTVWRTVRTAPVPLRMLDATGSSAPGLDGGGDAATVVLQSDDHADSGTTIVQGTWPTGPGEAALEERAAEALGLAVGDRILVGPDADGREFVISALWRADEPLDARWFADPAVASGHSGDAIGPLIVSEADLSAVTAAATTRWVIEPDAGSLTLADLSVIESASRDGALAELLARADVFGSNSVTVEGGLHDQVARTSQAASAARAVSLVPAVLVATLSMIAVLQLATLLAGSRSADTRLLRARGASVTQLTVWAGVEIGVVAVAAALLGAAAGVGAGWLLADRVGDVTDSLAGGGLIAVAAALVAALLGTARAAVAAWAAGGRPSAARSSGAPVLVAAVFASALTVLAGWQLIAAGSPLVGAGDGADSLNPLAVVAPGVGLLALALFAVAGVAPLIRIAGAGARRARSLTRLLVVRTLTRRSSLFTVAVLVTALASGGAVFAAVVSGSLVDADQRTAALQTGADVRARFAVPPNVDLDGPVVSSVVATDAPGATAAAAALSTTATLGTDGIGLVALPVASVPRLVPDTQLAEAVATLSSGADAAPGLAILPAGSTALTLSVALTGTDSAPLTDTAGTVSVAAWLADAGGAVSEISLGEIDAATVAKGTDFTGRLPVSVGETTLLGVDVARVGSAEESRSTIALERAAVVDAGGEVLPVELTAGADADAGAGNTDAADRLSADVTRQTPRGRILSPAAAERVPVTFTTALAARLGSGVGDELTLVPSTGQSVDVVVAAIVDAVPGSGRDLVAFADSAALTQGILNAGGAVPLPGEVWVATSAPDQTAAAIASTSALAVTSTTRAEASAAPVFEPALAAVRAGVAGGVAIALVCLVAVAAALLRARRGEAAVLSALGSTGRDDVAERRSEAGAAIGYGLIAGAVAGVLTASVFAPIFARAAVPGAEAAGPVFGLDPHSAGVALGALAVGAVAIVGVYGALVRRSR